jgi:platelet-activating factor acetylhydrolase IB subunit beta/gamma
MADVRQTAFILSALFLAAPLSAFAQTCPSPSEAATTMKPVDRSEIRPERRQKIQSALASQSYGVITLGDSIMEGWRETRLDSIFGMTVINSGFGQDATEHVLWRLQTTDWHGQSPHYVLLLVGTNDIGRSTTCDVYWGIRTVVSKVHGVFPNARVVVISILPRGENMLQSDNKIRATNLELKVASTAGNFAFFDPHDAFLCHHQTPCSLFLPDHNLHLTTDGYDLLDDLLKKFLAQDQHGQRSPTA